MNARVRCSLALVILVSLAGCGPQGKQELPFDLLAAVDAFYAAVESGDVEARIALFSDDAIMMPNHWTLTEGREAIAEGIRAGDGWVFRLRDRTVVDSDVSGDLAYLANSYEYTWHRQDAEPQWHRTKNVHIWKRDPDGKWKLHLDIWNSDVPLGDFAAEGLPEQERE
jgi:ketosteroid isomerase-like protein